MAKKQSFTDKLARKTDDTHCSICDSEKKHVRQVKAVKTEKGSWKFRSRQTAVCKCNENEIYV